MVISIESGLSTLGSQRAWIYLGTILGGAGHRQGSQQACGHTTSPPKESWSPFEFQQPAALVSALDPKSQAWRSSGETTGPEGNPQTTESLEDVVVPFVLPILTSFLTSTTRANTLWTWNGASITTT